MSADWAAQRQNQKALGQQALQCWAAEVVDAPSSSTEAATVKLLNGGMHGFTTGAASWPKPAGKALPSVGDICLVILDEGRQPWIAAWFNNWGTDAASATTLAATQAALGSAEVTITAQAAKLKALEESPRFEVTGNVAFPHNTLLAYKVEKLAIGTVVYDTAGWWNAASKRWIPKIAGLYTVFASMAQTEGMKTAGHFVDINISKNGTSIAPGPVRVSYIKNPEGDLGLELNQALTVMMNGTTDFIELFGNNTEGTQKANLSLSGFLVSL